MRKALGLFALIAPIVAAPTLAVDPGTPTQGPDVTVIELTDTWNYGTASGFRGYSVGTNSCNIGSDPVNWCNNNGGCAAGHYSLTDDQHPVIAQGLYRLRDGRFEQVGMSWLKHGFLALNTPMNCRTGTPCAGSPLGGDMLGVGCTDIYGSSLNGSRPLGQRSAVNATTGVFPYPFASVGASGPSAQRLRVADSDVDPVLNADANYWIEAQYVVDNDATAGNALNNASYQVVDVDAATLDLDQVGGTIRERSVLYGWRTIDPLVQIHNVDVPGDIVQRFEAARRVTDNGDGTWHYEFAVRNMNSDRSARLFRVDFPDGTTITGEGFHDVDSHSGEPYLVTDWTVTKDAEAGTVTWSTVDFATDPNANALRWATMFSFWFDADAAPSAELYALGLFKPGSPEAISWIWPLFNDGFESHNLASWDRYLENWP